MDILHYTEGHILFRKQLRAFLKKEVIPFVDQWEKERIVPKDIWKKMGLAGFLCMAVSPKYGGLGGDFGILEKYPIARAWRDVRVMSIYAGTNEIMKGIAAKFMGL